MRVTLAACGCLLLAIVAAWLGLGTVFAIAWGAGLFLSLCAAGGVDPFRKVP